jgi:4-hydroxy-4-methyl-2-oxoglutarate aldolase
MSKFPDDAALFASMRTHLFTAVVGDVLDKMGYLHQFLPPEIRPLREDMVAIGRAMPVLEADFFLSSNAEGRGEFASKPFGLMFRALDSLKPHEIYIGRTKSTSPPAPRRATRCGASSCQYARCT